MVHGLETLEKLNKRDTLPVRPGSAADLADSIEFAIKSLKLKDNISQKEILDTIEDVIVNFF